MHDAAPKPASRWGPWWIPPFLGRVPAALGPEHLRVLGMVSLALLFEEYDASMLTSALKHIARDLGILERDFGLTLAIIRAGAIPALFVMPVADRIGRRPVFLASTVALGLATFGSAFAASKLQFVLAQSLTRTFFVTSSAVAFVIVTEELPAAHRGWGMGMLAALGACGNGLGALLFSQIDRLPYGWRALYAVGVVPVLLLPQFAKHVPETRRFDDHARQRAANDAPHPSPLRTLIAQQPLRALGLLVSGIAMAAAMLPTFQFSGYFTQTKHAFSPGKYATMVITGGAIGIFGSIAAGRMGDAFGRRRVGFVMLALFPLTSFAFYAGPAPAVFVVWVPMVFCSMGGRIILRSLSTELFATAHRAAASGLFTVAETIGAVAGLLAMHAFGTADVVAVARVVPLVAALVLVSAACLLAFPEARHRELEDLSAAH